MSTLGSLVIAREGFLQKEEEGRESIFQEEGGFILNKKTQVSRGRFKEKRRRATPNLFVSSLLTPFFNR